MQWCKKRCKDMNTPTVGCLLIICFILAGIATTRAAYAKGLSVSPAVCKWDNARLGTLVECPMPITIKNNSTDVRTFTLRVVRLSELKVDPSKGYKELPSKRWISFDRKLVSLGPGQEAQVKMSIKIPHKRRHRSKKWEFFVEVKEYIASGETFVLACYPKIYLHTQGRMRHFKIATRGNNSMG